jgi:hypothetical protein
VAGTALKPIGALGNALTETNVPLGVAGKAAHTIGGTVKAVTGAGSALLSAKKYAKENNMSYGEALQHMTNAKDTKQAAWRIASLNISNGFTGTERVSQKLNDYGIAPVTKTAGSSPNPVNTSIDGLRYR